MKGIPASAAGCSPDPISWAAWIWWSACIWSTELHIHAEEDEEAAAAPSLKEVSLQVSCCSWNWFICMRPVLGKAAAAAAAAGCGTLLHPLSCLSSVWFSPRRDGNQWGASWPPFVAYCWFAPWSCAFKPRKESSAEGTMELPLSALASAALVRSPKFTELEFIFCCSCCCWSFSLISFVDGRIKPAPLDPAASCKGWGTPAADTQLLPP